MLDLGVQLKINRFKSYLKDLYIRQKRHKLYCYGVLIVLNLPRALFRWGYLNLLHAVITGSVLKYSLHVDGVDKSM